MVNGQIRLQWMLLIYNNATARRSGILITVLVWLGTIILLTSGNVLRGAEENTGPPQIHGALIYGERPGRPFLFTISATGKRPMTFDAAHLPKGLQIDPATGIITGRVAHSGKYDVTLVAKNEFGSAWRNLKIIIG